MSIGSLITLLFIKHFNILNKFKALFFINIGLNFSYILWANSKIITLACLMNILIGFFETYTSILTNTIVQQNIDNKYLGRVFSLIKIATVLSAIVGIIIAPILLNLIGAANVVTIFGISLIIMNLIMLLSSKKINFN